MSGIGGSNNSSSTRRDYNTNAGFSDINDNASVTSLQGIVLNKNAKANFSVTDGGAVKSAFDFAADNAAHAYDFSRDISKSTADTVGAAVQAVSESARSETENIFINLQKYLFYGAIIWGAVMIFKGVKK